MAAAQSSDPGKRGSLGCQWGWASLFVFLHWGVLSWLTLVLLSIYDLTSLPSSSSQSLGPTARLREEGWGCPGDAVGFCLPSFLLLRAYAVLWLL